MSRIFIALSGMLFLLNVLSSCKPGKKSASKNTVIDSSTIVKDSSTISPILSLEKKQLVELLFPISQRQIAFTTFNGKAKMHFQSNTDKQEFTANIRMKKDSVIWVSITALGGLVQVARLMITADSIQLVNYLQKEVTLMKAEDAGKLLPVNVNFQLLQNLIIGNALVDNSNVTDATDFGGTWSLQTEDSGYIQQLSYNKSDSTLRICQTRSRVLQGPAIVIQFGNYNILEKQHFPASRAINIINGQEQYFLDMDYSNADINQAVDFPFSIPKKYTVKQ